MDLESLTGDPSNVNTDRLLNPKTQLLTLKGTRAYPSSLCGKGWPLRPSAAMGSQTQGKEDTLLKIFPNRRYFLYACVDQCPSFISFTDNTISGLQIIVQTNDYKMYKCLF